MLEKQAKRIRRHKRVRAKIKGTGDIPRLCVFRSNKYIEAQLIDDGKGQTLASVKEELKKAEKAGQEIAKKAEELKIKRVVFDRGGYKYHGNVKKLAEAARKQGLKI